MVKYQSYVALMTTTGWRVIRQGADAVSAVVAGIPEHDVVLAIAIVPFAIATKKAVEIAAAEIIIIAGIDDLHSLILKHARFSFLYRLKVRSFFLLK